jgi:hypothetical protein
MEGFGPTTPNPFTSTFGGEISDQAKRGRHAMSRTKLTSRTVKTAQTKGLITEIWDTQTPNFGEVLNLLGNLEEVHPFEV